MYPQPTKVRFVCATCVGSNPYLTSKELSPRLCIYVHERCDACGQEFGLHEQTPDLTAVYLEIHPQPTN